MSKKVTEKLPYWEFRKVLMICMQGMTQKEYAELTGISQAHINRMVNQPVISRPQKALLQKMLRHLPAMVSPYELFASCGYEAVVARTAWREVRMQQSIAERIACNVQDLHDVVNRMKQDMTLFKKLEDMLMPFCLTYGLNYQTLRFEHDLIWENPTGHRGQIGVPCRIRWSVPYNREFLYDMWQYVVFYFIQTSDGYFIQDVAADAVTLSEYGVLDVNFINSNSDISLLDTPFVVSGTLIKRSYLVSIQQYGNPYTMDEDGNPIFTPLKNQTWGRGSFITEIPNGFHAYMLANKEWFCESANERQMIQNLERLHVPADADELSRVSGGYAYRNAMGYLAVLLAILNRKAKAKGLWFEIEYGISESEQTYLKPCLFVREEKYLTRGDVDEEALHQLDAFLRTELKELQVLTYGTVMVYHTDLVDVRESSFWQEPLTGDIPGWDAYKLTKEAWMKKHGISIMGCSHVIKEKDYD